MSPDLFLRRGAVNILDNKQTNKISRRKKKHRRVFSKFHTALHIFLPFHPVFDF